MSGWILIISLLVLGGVLSTLGDRLGSRIGKARLSLFNLRPKSTAVFITVLTGSLISALSLGFLLLVSRQLRVGLFELDDLQERLQNSRRELLPLQRQRNILQTERLRLIQDIEEKDADIKLTRTELESVRLKIKNGEKELKQLESNLIALRRGDVVLGSGQSLATLTLDLKEPDQSRLVIDRLLQEANLEAYRLVRPGEKPNKQILLVPKEDIKRLEQIIRKKRTWVINIRSAANVLRGEKLVYAFPEVRPNLTIVKLGEVISETILEKNETSSDAIRRRLKLLLASTFAEVKRRGSLTSRLQFDANMVNELGQSMLERKIGSVKLQAVSIRSSDTADPISVVLKVQGDKTNSSFTKNL